MAVSRGAVRIEGLEELIELLQRRLGADGPWAKELAAAHKQVGERAAEWARFSAAGGTRQQATAIDRIKGRGFKDKATIGVYNAGVTQYALGAFYGGYKRHGWYSADRYRNSAGKQFPKWVGNSWDVGGAGGPYHVNSSIRDHMDDVLDFYWNVVDKLMEG